MLGAAPRSAATLSRRSTHLWCSQLVPARGICRKLAWQLHRSASCTVQTSISAGEVNKPATMQANTTPGTNAPSGPKEVPAGVESQAKLLQAFLEVASLSKVTARVVSQPGTGREDLWITATYAQRNLPANNQRKYTVQGYLASGSTQALTSPPAESADVVLSSLSPTGNKQLVVKAGADNISTVFQLWAGNRMGWEVHVPKSLHGGVMAGGTFAADLAWHAGEQLVAYVAEVAADERTPVWGGPEAIKDAAAPKGWRGVGTAVEDWGELNAGKRAPSMFLLDLANQTVTKVAAAGLPGQFSFGMPVWAPDGQGLVVVGYPHGAPNFPNMHKRLGVVYCYNRPAQLWYLPVARPGGDNEPLVIGQAVPLTKQLGSAVSPFFSPDGTQLLYTCHDTAVTTGTHSATAQLCSLDWPQASKGGGVPRVVVDVVQTPDGPPAFPGLYSTGSAPVDQPFIGAHTVLINSQWRSCAAILAVDTRNGQVTLLSPVDQQASYSLACIAGGRLLATRVSPTQPAQLVVADVPSQLSGLSGPLDWRPIAGFETKLPAEVLEHVANLEYKVQQVTPTVGDKAHVFESLIWRPRNKQGPLPTILAPHGGPHTAVTHGWFPSFAYLAALGYAVVSPNYRGSTGFGQAALQSLPGNIGRADVDDCMAALQSAVDAGIADAARVVVVGGSHGGFLTGHLLGQFPDAFKAGVLRNPVTNISLMVGLSDITDWCYVEVGAGAMVLLPPSGLGLEAPAEVASDGAWAAAIAQGMYQPYLKAYGCEEGRRRARVVPLPEDLQRMYSISPAAHVNNVKVPVLLLLGAKDKRVPIPDGLQYQAGLRAAGVDVRTVIFPEDSHPLDKPQTEFEQWVNVAAVMQQHAA